MNCRDKRDKRDIAGHSASETVQLAATSATLRDMILVYGCPGVADVAATCEVAKPCLTMPDQACRGCRGKSGGIHLGMARNPGWLILDGRDAS